MEHQHNNQPILSVPADIHRQSFTRLFSEIIPDLIASVKALIFDGEATNEILQNAAVVLWEKYWDVSEKADFRKIAFTVVRYEILSFRRDKARNRVVFDESLIDQMIDQSSRLEPLLTREQELLQKFIALLPHKDRQLLHDFYQSGRQVNEIAHEQGKTPMSLYKKLQKIRASLLESIRAELAGD
ncbi:MAG: sigma-70 family RNA polymerase sigma factor [Planctomycetaceae bacterium]|nr:sigma-70 family RNA polymerase sigma factor [Planctomycetaceae bacterium]